MPGAITWDAVCSFLQEQYGFLQPVTEIRVAYHAMRQSDFDSINAFVQAYRLKVEASYGKSNAKREFAGKEVAASRNPTKKQRHDSASKGVKGAHDEPQVAKEEWQHRVKPASVQAVGLLDMYFAHVRATKCYKTTV
ncbi:hypothetical protein ABBQ38_000806 [Trebouxia sp. C0009 RCD-2024]